MKVGVPKEVKADEYRVAMMPVGVELLTRGGHKVFVEKNAGVGSGFNDEDYEKAGAKLIGSHEEVFDVADMIVKVKEPQPKEIGLFKPGQIVFTYFHFAADQSLLQGCLESEITAIAYETITDRQGRLPLLTPMSEIAGKLSIQEGAKFLEKPMGGRGILLGGVPGVPPASVLVLGGGVVGTAAARVAAGMGANVTLMDVNLDRLRYLDDVMPANVTTIYSDAHTIREALSHADLVVGAVLIPGAKAPRLVTRAELSKMKAGSVIVDVAIDQGGCIETSRPTTHQQPTFTIDNVVHYCVTNMPGAVGRTSTIALCNSTLSYALKLANKGYEKAAEEDPGFGLGINLVGGRVTNAAVADSFHIAVSADPRRQQATGRLMALPTSEKLAQLFKLLEREPSDAFLQYGIGMEYKKLGALDEAIRYFDQTIATDAGYCYAYYQRGQVLDLAGRPRDAKLAFEAGIVAANRKGDAHAASELSAALEMISEC